MAQYNFGVGTLICKRTDVANQKPAFLGVLQDVDLNMDLELKELVGQYNVAEAIAGGQLKITLKAKFARIQATTIGNMFLGGTPPVAGQTIMAQAEAKTIVANTFTVTNSATFVEDLGVFNSTDGVQLQPVAAAPAIGQYTVAAGVYTFNASETPTTKLAYYNYTTTGGFTSTLSKQLMGPAPSFSVSMQNQFSQFGVNKQMYVKLNAVTSGKLALPFKNKDFTIQEMDMQAFCDASGNWGTISTTE